MKQLNSKKTLFPQFDKILSIAEVCGESNERQLEIVTVVVRIEDNQFVIFLYEKYLTRMRCWALKKRMRSTSFFNALQRIRVKYFSI